MHFKTVDEVIDHYKNTNRNILTRVDAVLDEYIIRQVVMFHTDILFHTLKQKSNIPSKYDLSIIRSIHKGPIVGDHKNILEIYNNRK